MNKTFGCKSVGDNRDGLNIWSVLQVGSGSGVWDNYRWLGDTLTGQLGV